MSYVMAAPEMMAAAATDGAAVGSTLSAAHMAAAAPTVAVIPPAADEVSASIAHLFSRYAQDYQSLAGRAAAFHEQFVQHLNASARSYAATEAANATSLQHLNASAGSSASAIAALSGPLLNLSTTANAAVGQLLNMLRNALNDIVFYAKLIVFLAQLIPYLAYIFAYLAYSVLRLLITFALFHYFGVSIPI